MEAIYFSSHSPRRSASRRGSVVAFGTPASHWLGHVCDARPSLIGWRKCSMPFLGAEPRSEVMEAPPTPSAKNTWAMATGLSEGRCRCCCCCCCCCCSRCIKPDYKITHSAHTKLTHSTEGRDPDYKHILIEITELRGLLSVCVQMASGFIT